MKIKLILLILFVTLLTGCAYSITNEEAKEEKLLTGTYHVVMKVKDYGDIELELDADKAPLTVTNFINLVNDKFYDGLTFHRIIEGFMIQGGDPSQVNSDKEAKTITGEFSLNHIENDISHTRGVISMARLGNDYNSASSQFFIVQEDSTYLDGEYAAFGHVTSGIEVVDNIAKEAQPIDDNGTIAKELQPVIESIKVIK